MSAPDLARLMEPVARALWGPPNARLSSPKELRWGANGARSIDLETGVFYDHEGKKGGGVLDLLTRETGLENGQQFDWLREHGFDIGSPPDAPKPRIVATYDYADEIGEVLLQVVRYEPKMFRQRRPDPSLPGGWSWKVKGVRPIPYRLPELIEAIATGSPVFIVEGEKDADALWALGIPATCNFGGAGKWPQALNEHFIGAHVVIAPDNDEAGRAHRDIVGAALKGIAETIRVLDLPGLGPKGDVSDWLERGGTAERLYALLEKARPWSAPAPHSKFGAVRFSDIFAMVETREWLVSDLIPAESLILLYGASQSGKSFLGVDIGLKIAEGNPVFDLRAILGGVVYQAGEGGRGLIKRLKAYSHVHGIAKGADLPFVLLTSSVDLYSSQTDTGELIAEIKAYAAGMGVPLRLVVIDTLANASPGANENASEDMSVIISNCKRIKEECTCSVMIVHHKNAAGERPRGHTSLFAAADAAIEVSRDDHGPGRTAKLTKQKDGEDGKAFDFRLQPVEIGTDDDGKPITSCVVVPAQAGSQRIGDGSTGSRKLSDPAALALRALKAALIDHGVPAPQELLLPQGTQAVEFSHWRQTFLDSLSLDPEAPQSTIRSVILRAGNELLRKGLIGRSKHHLWLSR